MDRAWYRSDPDGIPRGDKTIYNLPTVTPSQGNDTPDKAMNNSGSEGEGEQIEHRINLRQTSTLELGKKAAKTNRSKEAGKMGSKVSLAETTSGVPLVNTISSANISHLP